MVEPGQEESLTHRLGYAYRTTNDGRNQADLDIRVTARAFDLERVVSHDTKYVLPLTANSLSFIESLFTHGIAGDAQIDVLERDEVIILDPSALGGDH